MTDPKKPDFLDEVIAERTAENPDFPRVVEEHTRARELDHIIPIYGCPVMFEDPPSAGPAYGCPPMADNMLQEDHLYDLTLENCSDVPRAVTILRKSMSMADAFKAARALPYVVLSGVSRWEAEELQHDFEMVGAVATLKRSTDAVQVRCGASRRPFSWGTHQCSGLGLGLPRNPLFGHPSGGYDRTCAYSSELG